MNIATWSIRNPLPVILLFVLMTLAGLQGFQTLRIQNLPDLALPTVSVSLVQPGAAPAQLETEVARKVENAISGVDELRRLTTRITDGQVSITAEFNLGKPVNAALTETRDAIDSVRADLPIDLQPPIITAQTLAADPLLTYAVASDQLSEERLSWFVDDAVSRALVRIPGMGRLERIGGGDREIRVEVDPARMAGLGVTAAHISRALAEAQQQSSGGRGQVSGAEQAVRVIATVQTADELAALPIVIDGRRIRLDQVATVHDTQGERTQGALVDGRPVVGFRVYAAKGHDEVEIARQVEHALEALERDSPGIGFTQIANTAEATFEQYEGSMHMLYEGALLAVLVVFLFLRDWRATLIAAIALPLSILPAFALMNWLGFSLNTVTLLALAIVVGVLVDDAIVEIENIARHRHMGKPPLKAAGDAVTEIAMPVLATTLTLVAVFVPTTLMPGVAGLVFRQFGWTAAIAVLASLLVARLLTPLMAAYLLKAEPTPPSGKDGALMRRYLAIVRWSLSHRWITLGAALVIFAASLAIAPTLPTGLLPSSDHGTTSINVELPPGAPYDETLETAEAVRRALSGVEGIRSVFTMIGAPSEGGEDIGEVRRASLMLLLAPRGERPPLQDIERQAREKLAAVPGARFTVGGGGPGGEFSMIFAGDSASVATAARAFERDLRSIGDLAGIVSTAQLERQEVVVRPDWARAAEQGVSAADIGDAIRVATSGDFTPALAKLNLDSRQTPIRVRLPDRMRTSLEALSNLRVAGRGGLIPLSSVADIRIESGPSQIDRYNRERFITVSADLNGAALGDAMTAAARLPSVTALPPGVSLIETGDAELVGELVSGFVVAGITGILLMYAVLLLLFRDVLQPFTILSAIPLALGGSFVALLLFGGEMNLPVMIGLVLLMGIVAKNSILLVEYAVLGMTRRELAMHDALLDACRTRARPIIMTSLAMIAGMVPIAIGVGADASFRQPMAIAVIGGLVTSTVLSLVFVPVGFSLMAGLERRLKQGARRFARSPEPQEASG